MRVYDENNLRMSRPIIRLYRASMEDRDNVRPSQMSSLPSELILEMKVPLRRTGMLLLAAIKDASEGHIMGLSISGST